MLLTSGQVSLAISSAIVVVFTFALFIAGYVLQQQTLHSLQVAIKPRIPKNLAAKPVVHVDPPNPYARLKRSFGSRDNSLDDAFQQYLTATTEPEINWNRLAHVQVVRSHDEVCSAVMLFGALHGMKSPAQRVLMFPRLWTKDAGEDVDPYLGTTRKLLQMAARRYRVDLLPVEPFISGADDTLPSSYSLSRLFTLTQYDRAMYLSAPGVVIDSLPLDGLLAFSPKATVSTLDDGEDKRNRSSILLIEPSEDEFLALREIRSKQPMNDQDLFQTRFGDSVSHIPPSTINGDEDHQTNFTAHTFSLRTPAEGFNATIFLESTAYVQFNDPDHPGPQYDVPWSQKSLMRPKNEQAKFVWDRMYDLYRRQRIDHCRMDLEEWKSPEIGIGVAPVDE